MCRAHCAVIFAIAQLFVIAAFCRNCRCLGAEHFKDKLVGKDNQTVNDGVAHSKNPKKCAYHVTFDLDLDLDLEHTLDACLPGDHRVQVWW